jgi:hypothetical protein
MTSSCDGDGGVDLDLGYKICTNKMMIGDVPGLL